MAHSNCWLSSLTQIFWACKSLIDGRVLSTITEICEVNGWRLAAVTEKLRKQYGWPILTEYIGPENITHYPLAPGTDISRLRFPPSATTLAKRGEPMTTLGTIRKNSHEELRISIDEFRGMTLVSLRVWFQAGEGEMRPGRQGLALRPEALREVLAALHRADVELTGGGRT